MNRKPTGFSLVELLVSLAVIAILATILLPVVHGVRETANKTECADSLRQIGLASMAFAAENSGGLPVVDKWRLPVSDREWVVWHTLLAPYLGDMNAGRVANNVLMCPSAKEAGAVRCYTMNRTLLDYTSFTGPIPQSLFTHPGTSIFIYDTLSDYTSASMEEANPELTSNAAPFSELHGGKSNVLFIDGHVGTYSYAETLDHTPNWWSKD